jgi:hypothetical protein
MEKAQSYADLGFKPSLFYYVSSDNETLVDQMPYIALIRLFPLRDRAHTRISLFIIRSVLLPIGKADASVLSRLILLEPCSASAFFSRSLYSAKRLRTSVRVWASKEDARDRHSIVYRIEPGFTQLPHARQLTATDQLRINQSLET